MTPSHSRRTWVLTASVVFCIILAAGGLVYWKLNASRVSIDTALIQAPEIDLAPSHAGVLQSVSVQPGDQIPAQTVVAQVGNELIKSKIAGIVVSVEQKLGAQVNAGQTIVAMIDPAQLRVVGKVDENKGLSRIAVGDRVVFTVDAFGSTQYPAVIDEVSPTSEATQIVFNISDSRQVQQFDVKARFDPQAYPELKSGMSARMWVYAR